MVPAALGLRLPGPVARGSGRTFAVLGVCLVLALLSPGLSAHGLWGAAELPILERSLARIGLAHGTFETAPLVPDLLRGRLAAIVRPWLGVEAAARLWNLAGVAALGALAAGTAAGGALRRVLAAAFVCVMPLGALMGSTALGDPAGEAFSVAATVALLRAEGRPAIRLAALALLAGALAWTGLLWGGVLPCLSAGLAARGRRSGRLLAAAGFLGLLAAVGLAVRQGDGFLPILAAAKDRAFLDAPEGRDVAAGIAAFLHQTFPLGPVALLAAIAGPVRLSWARFYLAIALVAAGPWILVYGTTPLPILVPTAVLTAALIDDLLAHPGPAGRIFLVFVTGSLVALSKDAAAYPDAYLNLLGPPRKGAFFPAEALDLGGRLARTTKLALACTWLAAAARSRRPFAARGVLLLGAFVLAVVVPHGIVRPTLARLSLAPLLATYDDAVARGAIEPPLRSLRTDAPEIEVYARTPVEKVPHKRTLASLFAGPIPSAALVREADLAGLFQLHRQDGWPLFVLDDRHATARLVANTLPPGLADRNRLARVVLDAPVPLEHPTYVRFGDAVEVIGWEIDGPVVRGGRPTVRVLLHVIGRLPAAAKIIVRLQAGRTSRIGAEPVEITGGLYPPAYMRPGDYILHEHRLKVPVLEVLTGPHRVVLGLRRNDKKNLRITEPLHRDDERGVRILDRAHHFATVGEVMVF